MEADSTRLSLFRMLCCGLSTHILQLPNADNGDRLWRDV